MNFEYSASMNILNSDGSLSDSCYLSLPLSIHVFLCQNPSLSLPLFLSECVSIFQPGGFSLSYLLLALSTSSSFLYQNISLILFILFSSFSFHSLFFILIFVVIVFLFSFSLSHTHTNTPICTIVTATRIMFSSISTGNSSWTPQAFISILPQPCLAKLCKFELMPICQHYNTYRVLILKFPAA